jgi:uncharacterized membrane protein (UPF0127 family)
MGRRPVIGRNGARFKPSRRAADHHGMTEAQLDARFRGLPVTERADGTVIIEAQTHRSRRRGLARLDSLPASQALHIPGTPSVHTVGMRFALDLIWLGRDGQVVRVDRNVGPWRMRFCRRARSVIETVAGQADAFLSTGLGRD